VIGDMGHSFESCGILAYSIGHQRCSLRCRGFYSLVFGLGYQSLAIISPRWNNDLTMRWANGGPLYAPLLR
jgi:hypothetical protein